MQGLVKRSIFVGAAAILGLTAFGIMQPADAHCHNNWRHERWEHQRWHNGYGGYGGYGGGYYQPQGYSGYYAQPVYPSYYGQPGLMTRMFGRL